MCIRIASAFLALLACPLLSAADNWFYLASPHFEIYTNTNRSRARFNLAQFEQMHAVMSTFFGEQEFPEPVRVLLFSSIKTYAPFALRDPQRYTGYYQTGQHRSYIVLRDVENYDLRQIFRSYAYLFLQRALPKRPPLWVMEGAADYYSTVGNYAGKLTVGSTIPWYLEEMRTGGFLTMEQIFSATLDSSQYLDQRLRRRFTAQSWGLIHMILLHDDYAAGAQQFFGRIAAGADSVSALQAAFPQGLKEIERDLKFYMRAGQFKVGVFPFKMPKLKRGETRAAFVDRDAQVALAELLLERRKWDQARDYLAGLAATYPEDADIAGLRGVEALRRDTPDLEAAGALFRAAIDGGSQSAWTHYHYADFARKTSADREVVAAAYRQAGEANRNLTWPYIYLGQVAMGRKQYGGAMSYFVKVIKSHPRNVTARRLAAVAYYELGADEQAWQMLESAEALADSATDREAVKQARARLEAPRRPTPAKAPAAVREVRAADPPPVPEPSQETPQPDPVAGGFDEVSDDVELETRVLRRRDDAGPLIVASERGKKLRPHYSRVEGRLVEVVCLGSEARFVVEAGGERFSLAIVNPAEVTLVRGEEPAAFDFQCGAQKPMRVEVEFDPVVPDGVENAAGVLVYMRFEESE